MKKIIFFIIVLICFSYSQNYGTWLELGTTFKSIDSTILASANVLTDSIPSSGVLTYYTNLEYIGRPEGSNGLFFWADSVDTVGDVPYCQIYFRDFWGRKKDGTNPGNMLWGGWNLLSFKKDTAFTSTTTYDSLTYNEQYFVQYEYDTYLAQFHQSKGKQYKIILLDTLGVVPYLSHFPR